MSDSLLGKDSFRRQCLELAHDIGNIEIHFQHLSVRINMLQNLCCLHVKCVMLYLDIYPQVEFFNETGEAFCRNLALATNLVFYTPNQFVQRSGEIGSYLCYIHYGIVEVGDFGKSKFVKLVYF